MKFQVMWAASIDAPSIRKAAIEALKMIAEGAQIFTVIDMTTGGTEENPPDGFAVDLRLGTVEPLRGPTTPEVAVTPLPGDEEEGG